VTARRRTLPQRSCVVCRETADKRALTRLVRGADGRIVVDERAREPGRGAYLCERPECWQRSAAVLGRALRATVTDQDRVTLQDYAAARFAATEGGVR
jgi:hypothetical protein